MLGFARKYRSRAGSSASMQHRSDEREPVGISAPADQGREGLLFSLPDHVASACGRVLDHLLRAVPRWLRREGVAGNCVPLESVMADMLQGIAVFDADERLLLANDRCAEIYGLARNAMKPGMSLADIVACQTAAAPREKAARFVEEIRQRVRDGKAGQLLRKLDDGRSIVISIRPRAEGGWVTTHQDITALARRNERLRRAKARLNAQNLQLDAALNHMVQGLAMFDGEQRLQVCNGRYADLYGLSESQLAPGTPLGEVLDERVATGHLSQEGADQLMQAMLRARDVGNAEQIAMAFGDGRCVCVTVQPTVGGGTVTTHQDITEQRRAEAKIVYMALHDQLTGLPNRVLLNERLEHALTRVKRGEVVATHLIDLDHFKTVNDTLGHPAGDKLLEMVADRLRGLVRETDTIARMGGDEFAIVQVAISSPADATSLAHRLIEVVSEPYEIEGQQVIIGTSVGIAIGPQDGMSPEQLIRNADQALYRAKSDGRRTFCFFEPEMDAQMQQRRATEYDLRKALGAGEFELHYQPVVNLERNRISGCEALIRWRHPKKGLVLPGQFIPLAEEIGFIGPLGDWVLKEACAAAARWPGDLRIAVNLSLAQVRSPRLVQTVTEALAASGLAAERLELEITETALLDNGEATLATLYQLREVGVHIVMDDFGTGYSSLSQLQSFPFDKIKIDRSFVRDIAEGVGSLNIVRAVVALAHGLGMTTTAEGVETQAQMEAVRAEGCTEMQGYLFARPLPLQDVEKLLSALDASPSGMHAA
ncbi:MAG: EAL domain-containing protein [Hyphomicrobiaceae bacterium]|nr:MAG: EAL domain-containing protein [Hyphomicrobiaceae bacterium]